MNVTISYELSDGSTQEEDVDLGGCPRVGDFFAVWDEMLPDGECVFKVRSIEWANYDPRPYVGLERGE